MSKILDERIINGDTPYFKKREFTFGILREVRRYCDELLPYYERCHKKFPLSSIFCEDGPDEPDTPYFIKLRKMA